MPHRKKLSIQTDIKIYLKNQSADFMHFVDISHLPKHQNKGFTSAILFGIVLSPAYLKNVSETHGYVEKMKKGGQIKQDEFHLTELKTDRIADDLAGFLSQNGFTSYSQSEANIEKTGCYDQANYTTPLPHKTIALLAGLGWIGKHNLLVTPKYGSGISMCSVLTNASLKTENHKPQKSKCGTCNICVEICPTKALTGNNWEIEKSREHIIDIHKCCTCYECVVHCPFTQKYIHQNL